MMKVWIVAAALLLASVASRAQTPSQAPSQAPMTPSQALITPSQAPMTSEALAAILGGPADTGLCAMQQTRVLFAAKPPTTNRRICNFCCQCNQTADCYACCRCAGHGPGYCTIQCYGW